VIVDSAAGIQPKVFDLATEPAKGSPQLVVFSANTQNSLQRQMNNHQEYIRLHPERLLDLAYTLSLRREHLPYRAFSIAAGGVVTNVSSFTKVSSSVPDIVMIFNGQGGQWPEMGRDLVETDQKFREDIIVMDSILQSLKHPPNWKIESKSIFIFSPWVVFSRIAAELKKPAKISQIHLAELAQPLYIAIQIALVNALGRCGIRPKAVIGHSSGEIAAAYASGALSLQEAIITAYYRGYIAKKQTLTGGMAVVGLSTSSTLKFLRDGVVIACENSPSSTTISGDLDQLESVVAMIREDRPDILARQLKVDMAYHSRKYQI
jgi:acyl transferase domain-containing protein